MLLFLPRPFLLQVLKPEMSSISPSHPQFLVMLKHQLEVFLGS